MTLNDVNDGSVVTDAAGRYRFNGVACNQEYVVTPAHPDFVFNPLSTKVSTLKKISSVNFVATLPEKTAQAPLPPLCNLPLKSLPEVKIGDSLTGRLSPESSSCESPEKGYFDAYLLKGAIGGEIVQFDLQPVPPAQLMDLSIQVFDQKGDLLKFTGTAGELPGQQLVLNEAGDYKLRVVSRSTGSSDYRLAILRRGISEDGYRQQLERAHDAIREPGNLTFYDAFNSNIGRLRAFNNIQATDQKIRDAAQVLEQLRELNPDKPEVFSRLSVIYLYYRKDSETAGNLAAQALRLGGEARFRVAFGEKLDKRERRVQSNARYGWLVIRNRQVSFEGFEDGEGELFKTESKLIGNRKPDIAGFDQGLTIYGNGLRAGRKDPSTGQEKKEYKLGSFVFIPLSLSDPDNNLPQNEVAIIKGLIDRFVQVE